MAPADGESAQPAPAPVPESSPAGSASQPRSIGTASTFSMQQVLLTIALSYLLLFTKSSAFGTEILEFVVAGLLSIVLVVMVIPHHLWRTRLIVWAVILGNTALCANVFYMAGLEDPGVYVSLLLLIAIAMYAKSVDMHFGLSLGVCVVYGIVWYVMVGRAEPFSEGDLLRFPVLLVIANFYWQIMGMRVGGGSA
jgi:hypothetical protein